MQLGGKKSTRNEFTIKSIKYKVVQVVIDYDSIVHFILNVEKRFNDF